MNTPDRELEDLMAEYEAEVAAYRRLPEQEPTAWLDRAIITKARAAVAHAPAPPADLKKHRWISLAASFAGIAVAAGIGWQVHRAANADRTEVAESSKREVMEVQVMAQSNKDRRRALDTASMPPLPPPPPPEPELRKPMAAPALADAPVVAEMAGPAEPFMDEAASMVAPAASAPAPQAPATTALGRTVAEPHRTRDHGGLGQTPERQQNFVAEEAKSSAVSSEAEALGARAEAAPDAAAAPGQALNQAPVREAGDWIRGMRRLLRERRLDELRSELRAFRAAHPEHPLPAELRRYAPK